MVWHGTVLSTVSSTPCAALLMFVSNLLEGMIILTEKATFKEKIMIYFGFQFFPKFPNIRKKITTEKFFTKNLDSYTHISWVADSVCEYIVKN